MAGACGGHFGCKWLLGGPREASASSPPCRLPHVPSFFAIHIHTALMRFPSGPRSVKQEFDLGPRASLMSFSDRHQGGFKYARVRTSWRSRSFKRCHQSECLRVHKALLKRKKSFVELIPLAKVLVLRCLKSPNFSFCPSGGGPCSQARESWLVLLRCPKYPCLLA